MTCQFKSENVKRHSDEWRCFTGTILQLHLCHRDFQSQYPMQVFCEKMMSDSAHINIILSRNILHWHHKMESIFELFENTQLCVTLGYNQYA
jgi:hypothetical protein